MICFTVFFGLGLFLIGTAFLRGEPPCEELTYITDVSYLTLIFLSELLRLLKLTFLRLTVDWPPEDRILLISYLVA